MFSRKLLAFLFALGFAISASAATPTVKTDQLPRAQRTQTVAEHSIDINKADVATFAKIKGIGKKKAEAIVAYREANGDFKSIEDLTKVKGIGSKRLGKIGKYLTV